MDHNYPTQESYERDVERTKLDRLILLLEKLGVLTDDAMCELRWPDVEAIDAVLNPPPPQEPKAPEPRPAPTPRYPYEMDTTFTFGKYSGYSVSEVLRDNPSYIVWAAENVERFKVNPIILADARTRTEDRAKYRAPAPTNYQPNFGRFSAADLDDDVPF